MKSMLNMFKFHNMRFMYLEILCPATDWLHEGWVWVKWRILSITQRHSSIAPNLHILSNGDGYMEHNQQCFHKGILPCQKLDEMIERYPLSVFSSSAAASVQTWDWQRSSHLMVSKKANKLMSQNLELFFWGALKHEAANSILLCCLML